MMARKGKELKFSSEPSKLDAAAKKAKGRFHLRWLAGPHILLNHVKQLALALPPLGPSYDIWGSNTSDFYRRVFYKNRASKFRSKIEKKNS